MSEKTSCFGKFVVWLQMIRPKLQIQVEFEEIRSFSPEKGWSFNTVLFLIFFAFNIVCHFRLIFFLALVQLY